jgi:GH25 family lysozyme M1 (1,4-beta-N-acetylmuramidase)
VTDYGIDVSHWNRVNDWHAVRGNNIRYASIKLTESTAWVDKAAPDHIAGARAAGIAVGGYHFARDTPIQAQVDHFARHLRRHHLTTPGSLAPMLDMEANELRDNANTFVKEFIRRLRTAAGVHRVLVYANLDWWRTVLRPAEWADDNVLLWIARYNGDPGQPGWTHPHLALHQHTQTGRVPGIPGHVDRNATIGGWRLDALTLPNTPDPIPPKPGPSPKPSPPKGPGGTYTIKPGDTLSGIAARYGTTVAVLVRINKITDPDRIYAGQWLTLP